MRNTEMERRDDAPDATPEGRTCGTTCVLWRYAPFALLAAAALFYLRDVSAARGRAKAAEKVRIEAMQPVAAASIVYRSADRSMPFVVHCPPPVVTNLLTALATAEPARFPRGGAEGEEFEIRLARTNDTVTLLRAVRIERDPENLFVGLKLRREGAEPAEWELSQPARVPGAGRMFGALLEGIGRAAEKLPPEDELRLGIISNATRGAVGEAD